MLDRYEQICVQCISLKEDVQNGKQVPSDKVSSLFQELARLRSELQNASGSMTDSQKRRFSAIRNSYQKQEPDSSTDVSKKPQPEMPAAYVIRRAPAFSVRTAPLVIPAAEYDIPEYLTFPDLPNTNHYVQSHDETLQPALAESAVSPNPWQIHLMGMIDIGRTSQYGASLAIGKVRYGIIIGALSNFNSLTADYDCNKDGSIPGGGCFWGDGSECDSRFRMLAGLYWSPADKLTIYANSGFCSDNIYWRDTQSQWARVSDLSGKGVLLGCGIIVPVKHISLTSGIMYDSLRKSISLNIGLGIRWIQVP